MSDKQRVIKVGERIIDLFTKKGWCRGAMARDTKGKAINIHNKNAEKFCMMGALNRVADPYKLPYKLFKSGLSDYCYSKYDTGIIFINDYRLKSKREAISFVKKFLKTLEN